ncbi:uncharacterized protein [Paramormyrops kingsleyae]|uniref:uncharacterized protein isoform X1 n=1 Tax=Paramormyrops kingsleyae TaxID=1676925 RepID=UPI000CD64D41|nr:uncharacterized protein LOC111839347 isoform X1 [Paramormyrops kingsleyae]
MENFVLFLGSKRVTLKEEDMTTEKISVIFQVQRQSVYLTDDANVAIFPQPHGSFNCFDLNDRGHYEVHGDSITVERSAGALPSDHPVRFSFHRTPSTAASSWSPIPRATMTKAFQRNVFIADVLNGKLETSKMVTVRLSEFEACVPSIVSKVKEALGQEESIILTDSQGNEIMDSEGTRGLTYWKQNSRKVFAVPEEQIGLLQSNKRRRLSRREDTGLQEVVGDIQEVVEAAQGLKDVSKAIKELSGFAHSRLTTTLSLSEAEVTSLKAVFGCLVCTGPIDKPIFSTCCRSLIGCKGCIEEWSSTHSYCPKCRAEDLENNNHEVAGLSEALAPLEKIFI